MKFTGLDDAAKAGLVPLEDLVTGKDGLAAAFCHMMFIRDAVIKLCDKKETFSPALSRQLNVLNELDIMIDASICCNVMIKEGVNAKFAQLNETRPDGEKLLLLTITSEEKEIYAAAQQIKDRAQAANINVSGYFDPAQIAADIIGCSNEFNQKNQRKARVEASDRVTFVRDTDDTLYVLGIKRIFAPGEKKFAFPGGFKEVQESFAKAAMREGDEEVGGMDQLKTFATEYSELPVYETFYWDPRGLGPHGFRNGGIFEYITISA